MQTNKRYFAYLLIGAAAFLVGCENTKFGAREKGALGGAAVGAGLGAIIGNQVGDAGAGIAIGSAFGALSGGLIGNELDNQSGALEDRKSRLDKQQSDIEENRRLIAELRAKGVDASVTDRGVSINLPDVLFAFGSAELTINAQETAKDIAQTLDGRTDGRRISIEGHTDSVGSESYNQRLSLNRARSVESQLVLEGIPSSQIKTRGFGENKPVASNSSDLGRQRNRRVEVILENRAQ
jgi:outer membrane protein OmpA-like peptidoglycan-associated protein